MEEEERRTTADSNLLVTFCVKCLHNKSTNVRLVPCVTLCAELADVNKSDTLCMHLSTAHRVLHIPGSV